MKKYRVCLIKYETYYVEAENMDQAEDVALLLVDDDPDAWQNDIINEIKVEEVKENEE